MTNWGVHKQLAHLYDLMSVRHEQSAFWIEAGDTATVRELGKRIEELKHEIIELEAEIYI